ncbi:MAG: hypothetical protein WC196_06675 [Bacilli bacterium]|jgi:hypothetical protein
MADNYIPTKQENCPKHLKALQTAYTALMKHYNAEGFNADIQLADAVDHVGAAIRALGYEPRD